MNRAAEKGLRDFVRRFAVVEKDIVAFVVSQLATGKLATLRERRRASRRVRATLASLAGSALPRLPGLVRSGYLSGRQRSGAPMRSLNKTDQEAITILVANLSGRLDDTIMVVGRRIDDIFRKEGLRAAAIAQARSSLPEGSRLLVERLQERGIQAFTDRAGRHWGLETYAQMAVKATMREAETHGARNLILRQNFDLVQVAYPSRREFDPDSACSPHHLKVYSLTGRAEGYPVMTDDRMPPFHPECYHFLKLAPEAVEERNGEIEAT